MTEGINLNCLYVSHTFFAFDSAFIEGTKYIPISSVMLDLHSHRQKQVIFSVPQ